MIELYRRIQNKTTEVEKTLKREIMSGRTGILFHFLITRLDFQLFFFEITLGVLKFLIILAKDPSVSFLLFFDGGDRGPYERSYCEYKVIRERVRLFSFTGAVTIIVVSVVAGLAMSLTIGSWQNALAATYTWTQTNWNSLTSNTTGHPAPADWTEYSAITIGISAGSAVTLSPVATSLMQTDDGATNTGFNMADAAFSQTEVTGTGASAGIVLSSTDLTWATTTIDTTGSVGNYTSLVLGSDGYARISYYDGTNQDLKFVQCASADCSTKNIATVDATGITGQYTSLAIRPSDEYVYISYYDSTNADLKLAYQKPVYSASGTYASGAIDIGFGVPSWGNLSWTHSGGQTITLKARSDADGDFSDATAWGGCSAITSGNALSTGGCVTDGHRFIEYQASLSTADTATTPSLDDVTIGYNVYPANQTLASSVFDSGDSTNVVGGLSWTEDVSLPSGTYTALSVRASSSAVFLSTTDWYEFTSTTTDCSKASGIVSCSLFAIPAGMKDGSGDEWVQYRITESSNGVSTPTISDVALTYVVNAPPEIQNVTAAQQSDGTVLITYETRDPDTTSGTVTPRVCYSFVSVLHQRWG